MRNGQMLALALYIAAVTKRIGAALLWFDEGGLDVCTVKYNTTKASACFLLHSSLAFLTVNLPCSIPTVCMYLTSGKRERC